MKANKAKAKEIDGGRERKKEISRTPFRSFGFPFCSLRRAQALELLDENMGWIQAQYCARFGAVFDAREEAYVARFLEQKRKPSVLVRPSTMCPLRASIIK